MKPRSAGQLHVRDAVMLRPSLSIALLLIALPVVAARPSCEITDYGILEPRKQEGVRDTPTTATGKVREFGAIKFKQRTERIPARLGLRFGVEHKFRNVPADGELQVLVIHPPIVKANGQTSTVSSARKNPADSGTNYGFDSEAELLSGTWAFEFKYRGNLLCRKAFTVFLP